ncbi:EFR1 family ferrodoxin [Clostridium beijerinckii]|uniref:EFR1 family ferrodoxin n=1 Tax=Clostridium beijerinckii TaxID=1520 RepID=UPI00047E7D40|nr:EFR1 family ferrodoxin [Clostridium beijerinckii]
MRTTIFYFTGTGNSLMLSRDLADEIGDARIISIPKAIQESEIDVSGECVGFVFPLYYQVMPVIVQDFIKKLQLNKSKYIFAVVNSRSFQGYALTQLSNLLSEQGTELAAGFHLLLPYNYIINPLGIKPPSDSKRDDLFRQEKLKVKEIAGIIKVRKRIGIEKKPLLKHVHPYSFFKKEKLASKLINEAKNFQVDNRCISCERCKSVCPVNNIEIVNGRPKWNDRCQQCLACINWCPKNAIEYKNITLRKKRYTNPLVTVKDMSESAAECKR